MSERKAARILIDEARKTLHDWLGVKVDFSKKEQPLSQQSQNSLKSPQSRAQTPKASQADEGVAIRQNGAINKDLGEAAPTEERQDADKHSDSEIGDSDSETDVKMETGVPVPSAQLDLEGKELQSSKKLARAPQNPSSSAFTNARDPSDPTASVDCENQPGSSRYMAQKCPEKTVATSLKNKTQFSSTPNASPGTGEELTMVNRLPIITRLRFRNI